MENKPKKTDNLDNFLKNNSDKKKALRKIIEELHKNEKRNNPNN